MRNRLSLMLKWSSLQSSIFPPHCFFLHRTCRQQAGDNTGVGYQTSSGGASQTRRFCVFTVARPKKKVVFARQAYSRPPRLKGTAGTAKKSVGKRKAPFFQQIFSGTVPTGLTYHGIFAKMFYLYANFGLSGGGHAKSKSDTKTLIERLNLYV